MLWIKKIIWECLAEFLVDDVHTVELGADCHLLVLERMFIGCIEIVIR